MKISLKYVGLPHLGDWNLGEIVGWRVVGRVCHLFPVNPDAHGNLAIPRTVALAVEAAAFFIALLRDEKAIAEDAARRVEAMPGATPHEAVPTARRETPKNFMETD